MNGALPAASVLFSPSRVLALVMRYLYLYRRSWTRLLELIYWPTVQMLLWGFMTRYLMDQTTLLAQASGVLISAVLLWDILYRSQLGVSLMFLEEMYARNLGHLFVSPLRPYEMVLALLSMSLFRTAIGVGGAAVLAFLLYHFSLFSLGFALIPFFVNLVVFGWALGLALNGIVLRYGLGAESMAWVVVFALSPISGIYYPISVLPEWVQWLAALLPSSYVFEGMRAVMRDGIFDTALFLRAAGLNAAYLALGMAMFLAMFNVARRRGLLLNVGE
jgi:ABC-2 type transport system permease protein